MPQQYENMYFAWMRDVQDWCISRQLWWGHRIPAWYDDQGNLYVGRDEREAREKGGVSDSTVLEQDADVLDTWFSSALWTFATLGWPEQTSELERFHPTDVLVTGHDIIFFWVARMIMMTLRFTGDVPFLNRLHARAGARCPRREDVEDQGQRPRPAGHRRRYSARTPGGQAHHRPDPATDGRRDRSGDPGRLSRRHPRLRHRRAALHLLRPRFPHRTRRQPRPRPNRRLSQLLQQAVEPRPSSCSCTSKAPTPPTQNAKRRSVSPTAGYVPAPAG